MTDEFTKEELQKNPTVFIYVILSTFHEINSCSMREGWEQNVFSNVFDLQMGKTPDRKSPEMFEGDNVWVTISDLNDKYVSESKEHISDDAASKIKIVKKGTVIMSFKLSVGKTAIVSKDLYTNEAIMAFNVNEGYNINNNFLYYYLSGYNWEGGNRAVMGMTLNKATISKQIIFIPPLSTQQSIVSELDSLSQIIADCKETLKDYDALEQSIFYDMFGDPVKNEKGWEVKKVIDVVTMQRGFDLPSSNRNSSGHIPVYGSNGILGMHNESKLSEGIITGRSGSIGEVYVSFKPFWPLNTTLFSKDTHGNNLTYLQFLLRNFNLKRFAEGAGVPTLNRNNFHNENIIAPPLPLQQQFASKIEAIEQMKVETKKALQEAETLFQARMDYWFG